jgi:hypothetical protein
MCDTQRDAWDKHFKLDFTVSAFISLDCFNDEDRVPCSLQNEMWGLKSLGKLAKILSSMDSKDRTRWIALHFDAGQLKNLLKEAKELVGVLMDIDMLEISEEETATEERQWVGPVSEFEEVGPQLV